MVEGGSRRECIKNTANYFNSRDRLLVSMKTIGNEKLSKASQSIMNAVDNQLRNNDPPEAREAYERLISQGFNDAEARQLIGSAISCETIMVLHHKKPFDLSRYVSSLNNLPDLPV
ncbi:MAG: hypothetical protein HQL78_12535 [Magnetococcales bacterium]|nr:hypothetical protein [Magnetococcales bacterium]